MNPYIIVTREAPDTLEEAVNKKIEDGYIPIGALTVKGCKLMQPMTIGINPEINVNAQVQNNY